MKRKPIKKWQLNLRPRNIISHKFSLDELCKCKMYDQQIEYCLKSLHLMSSGTSRLVFDYDNDSVIKVAKNSSGMIGNFYEASQTKLCPDLFPDITYVHEAKKDRYDFIVAQKVIPFTNDLMKSKADVVWEQLFSLLVWLSMKSSSSRHIWLQNYNTYLRCSIKEVQELNDKFMPNDNVVSRFINNVLKYSEHFDESLRPDVVSDFKIQNLGWSEKKNAIVVLDNGSNVHMNAIWNTGANNKKNKRINRLSKMIQDGRISSKTILDSRRS